MLEQYKKTLIPTQVFIAVITLGVLFLTHRFVAAMAFFVIMQVGALVGVQWGLRLKGKIERMPQR
jgi:hypothetical protein